MQDRIQILAIVSTAVLFFGILELVRRRRLLERYALLWLLSAALLLVLAIWRGALASLASLVGISYPPNALFFVAFGFILMLLLHFSVAVSRLADQSRVVAQRLALMEERLARQEHDSGDAALEAAPSALQAVGEPDRERARASIRR